MGNEGGKNKGDKNDNNGNVNEGRGRLMVIKTMTLREVRVS